MATDQQLKSQEIVSGLEVSAIINQDARDMARMGKVQETRRMFGVFPLLGFTTIMLGSWEAAFPLVPIGLINGGGPAILYGYIFCFLGSLATCASVAEMSSMYPTSGGQYHWVALLSPPKWSKFLSWLAGWLSVIGWQSGCASGMFIAGSIIDGLLVLNNPSYNGARWHSTLIMYAIILMSLAINTFAVRALPAIEAAMLVLHVVGFFAILIPFVYLAPMSTPDFVFRDWFAASNYADGLAWFVALTSSTVPFTGFDGACHMAEEVKIAAVNVPRSMFFTICLNGALGFAMYIALLFGIGNIDNDLNTPTLVPFIEILHGAVGSIGGATAMASIILALIVFASIGFLASASRQLWAFSRDKAMPFSSTLSLIDGRFQIPIPAIAATCTFSFVVGLVNLRSTVAFNAIVSTLLGALFTTYVISISLIIRKRLLGEPIPYGPWKLGRWGTPVNVFAIIYCIIGMVFSFFPPAVPVTAETMNYSSVMFIGILGLGLIYYFYRAHKVYNGPVIDPRFRNPAASALEKQEA